MVPLITQTAEQLSVKSTPEVWPKTKLLKCTQTFRPLLPQILYGLKVRNFFSIFDTSRI